MIWGGIIAWYLFLAGLGAGAYITSSLVGALYPEACTVRKIGRYIAPVVVIIGLFLLMFDAKAGLFHPWRFILLLSNFSSIMSWGVVFLSLFVVICLFVAFAELKNIEIPRWLDITGVVLAFFVAVYTGVLLGVVQTFPLWNTALLPILFLVSALSAGAAAVMGLGYIKAPREVARMHTLSVAHSVFPIVELVLIVALLFITSYANTAGHASVLGILAGKFAPLFWVGLIAIGLVIPAGLEYGQMLKGHSQAEGNTQIVYSSHVRIGVLAAACVLIGGFILRYLVVAAALPLTMVS